MKNVVSAGFIIYTLPEDKHLFLVLQYAAGHWDFAKGKVEKGESLQEAAARELYEETGLKPHTIADFEYSFDYTFTDYDKKQAHKKVVLFLAEVDSNEVQLSDEHQGYRWLPYQEALAQLTYENAQAALKGTYKFLTFSKC